MVADIIADASRQIVDFALLGVVAGGLLGWFGLANLPRLAEKVNVRLPADWTRKVEKACYETAFGACVVVAIATGSAFLPM